MSCIPISFFTLVHNHYLCESDKQRIKLVKVKKKLYIEKEDVVK